MKPRRIENYTFTPEDNLLLDANVWLFLFCPHGDPAAHEPAVYSTAYKHMLTAKSRLYVSSTILGEFVYRYCRLAHGLLVEKGMASENFKNFRKSGLFKPVAKAVTDAAIRLLKEATRVEEEFISLDIDRILGEFGVGGHDFNDLLIAEVCERKSLTLVTDDGDFSLRSIPILTANALLAN